MAATISDLANAADTTADTACTTGATVTAAVNDWLVVIAAASNDGTNGAASMTTVVDSDGVNVYTQRALINYDPGAAGAGATLGIYTCRVTSALSLDTITTNYSVNTSQKSCQVYKVVPGAGEMVSFISADTTGVTGNLTEYLANTVAVTSGDIIFGAAAIETDDTVTGDSDSTNGSWSSVLTRLADGGADGATMSCVSQYKTTTGTGNQVWSATTTTGRDSAISYLVLRSATVSVALTAAFTATGSAGSLAASISTALSGFEATGGFGTLVPFVSYSVALTGVEATGSAGAFSSSIVANLVGFEGTTAQGSFVASLQVSLPGFESIGTAGSLAPSITTSLVGVEGTSGQGSFSASIQVSLAGFEATGSIGTLSPAVQVTLSGFGAVSDIGTFSPTISCPLVGLDIIGAIGTLVPSSSAGGPGTFTYNGVTKFKILAVSVQAADQISGVSISYSQDETL